MRPVAVAVGVAADPASGVVERLVFVQPDLPFFEFPEPALDEGLRFGVAVAAAAVLDAELAEAGAEAAGGEGGAVVAAEHELARFDAVQRDGAFDDRDRFVGAAPEFELPGDDLAGAAVDDRVQVAPAVLGDPDRGHVELPQLPWPLDSEEAGPLAPLERTATLDQLPLPHHPQDAFAVDRDAELAAHECGHHPVAVGLIRDRLLDEVGWRPTLRQRPRGRRSIDRLPGDLQDARHRRRGEAACDQLARPGDALAHSQPRNASPAISSS